MLHSASEPSPVPREIASSRHMYEAVMRLGVVPLFTSPVPGFSIQERTVPEVWFSDEVMGPWDWKIDCVRSGDIAYGKFLFGGRCALVRADLFGHLANFRRAAGRYVPEEGSPGAAVLEHISRFGSITPTEARRLTSLTKSRSDSVLTKLQMATLLVVGELERVYNGPDLSYKGWQRASFCAPEEFFGMEVPPPFAARAGLDGSALRSPMEVGCTPEESYEVLCGAIREHHPWATDKDLLKCLR